MVEVTLLTYESLPNTPTVSNNNLDGRSVAELIDKAYNKIVKSRKSLILVPTGNEEKEIISEPTYCLEQLNQNTIFKGISMKIFIVLPSLLLQKPSATSKTKDQIDNLTKRLTSWKKRKLMN